MKGVIQRIIQDHGDAYLHQHAHELTQQHVKVIRAIQRCGTPAAGWIRLDCTDCDQIRLVERSCGSRMCPSCQTNKTAEWLDKRLQQQLPTHYFLITFTIPEQLRPLFLHAPKETYNALFAAAAHALKTLAGNPRFLGVDLPGFFGVLHTWGRALGYHPHVHFVVPGGGVDKAGGIWRSTRQDFYAPGQALARVFRGALRDALAREDLLQRCDPAVWQRNFTVDCQAVGQNREGVLKYLARYVFKTAITDSRVLSYSHGKVTFTYTKSGSNRPRRMTLDAPEFIRRYLQHVLPCGFMRIRYYGFMGSGCSLSHRELVALVRLAQGFEVAAIDYVPAESKRMLCPKCGAPLRARYILAPDGHILVDLLKPRPPKRE